MRAVGVRPVLRTDPVLRDLGAAPIDLARAKDRSCEIRPSVNGLERSCRGECVGDRRDERGEAAGTRGTDRRPWRGAALVRFPADARHVLLSAQRPDLLGEGVGDGVAGGLGVGDASGGGEEVGVGELVSDGMLNGTLPGGKVSQTAGSATNAAGRMSLGLWSAGSEAIWPA